MKNITIHNGESKIDIHVEEDDVVKATDALEIVLSQLTQRQSEKVTMLIHLLARVDPIPSGCGFPTPQGPMGPTFPMPMMPAIDPIGRVGVPHVSPIPGSNGVQVTMMPPMFHPGMPVNHHAQMYDQGEPHDPLVVDMVSVTMYDKVSMASRVQKYLGIRGDAPLTVDELTRPLLNTILSNSDKGIVVESVYRDGSLYREFIRGYNGLLRYSNGDVVAITDNVDLQILMLEMIGRITRDKGYPA